MLVIIEASALSGEVCINHPAARLLFKQARTLGLEISIPEIALERCAPDGAVATLRAQLRYWGCQILNKVSGDYDSQILSALRLACSQPCCGEPVILLTAEARFRTSQGCLPSPLLSEIVAACENPMVVSVSIEEFVEEFVIQRLEELRQLRSRLSWEATNATELTARVSRHLRYILPAPLENSGSFELPPHAADFDMEDVEVNALEVDGVKRLGDDLVEVTSTCLASARFSFYLHPADFALLDPVRSDIVAHEMDWTGLRVTLWFYRDVSLQVQFTLEPQTRKIIDIDFAGLALAT